MSVILEVMLVWEHTSQMSEFDIEFSHLITPPSYHAIYFKINQLILLPEFSRKLDSPRFFYLWLGLFCSSYQVITGHCPALVVIVPLEIMKIS
jgi:hypothetical protein